VEEQPAAAADPRRRNRVVSRRLTVEAGRDGTDLDDVFVGVAEQVSRAAVTERGGERHAREAQQAGGIGMTVGSIDEARLDQIEIGVVSGGVAVVPLMRHLEARRRSRRAVVAGPRTAMAMMRGVRVVRAVVRHDHAP
jgi:hypothetical protein